MLRCQSGLPEKAEKEGKRGWDGHCQEKLDPLQVLGQRGGCA